MEWTGKNWIGRIPKKKTGCDNRKCRYHDTTMIMHCARSISAEDDRPYALVCRAYRRESWDANPLVWVVEFRMVKK